MPKYSFQHTIAPRPNTNDELLISVLDGLLERYVDRVPDAQKVIDLVRDRGDDIINDHIAFRSIDIRSILRIFMHLGYEVKMDGATGRPFNFKAKKLTAVWLKHPNKNVPRVFVSEFRFDEGSEQLQTIISRYLSDWSDPINGIDLNDPIAINEYLHTAQWETPTYNDYKLMQQESEYVSWVLYNKYYLNHFTLSVHQLSSFEYEPKLCSIINNYKESFHKGNKVDSIQQDCIAMVHRQYEKQMTVFNEWLLAEGFQLNGSNKQYLNISPDKCLLQSSTKSNLIEAQFPDGRYEIPGSYVEFAYRGLMDASIIELLNSNERINSLKNFHRRDGFESQNADKIFESTYIGAEQNKRNMQDEEFYERSAKNIADFIQSI